MSAREWQPGDGEVAIISWVSKSGRSGGSTLALRCSREYGESHWQTQTFGEVADERVTKTRPLVVIDPEDREAVERLRTILHGGATGDRKWACSNVDLLQRALREFATPTPPKPEEPTGLGAVVEDASGVRWVRLSLPGGDPTSDDWRRAGYTSGDEGSRVWHFYADITAVRVLSEGVTA